MSALNHTKSGVCLNMIVKNETAVLNRLFRSLKDHIDYWVIVDTGSTDGTQDFIRNWFSQAGIPGELHERPWVNFGHNRQQALELAVASGQGDWLFFIDADEELHVSNPAAFSQLQAGMNYRIEKRHGDMHYFLPALVNFRDSQWRWRAPVHEYLEQLSGPTQFSTLDGAYIFFHQGEGFRSLGKTAEEKFLGDAHLLEQHLKENPDDCRSQFYLANSYKDAGHLEKAYQAYAKRCSMNGWVEENFLARLQLGRMAISLKKSENLILEHLLDAFDYRPCRAEPLYELARYYRLNNKFGRSMVFASHGSQMPPPDDRLFVVHTVYQWQLLDELGVSAYWAGDYETSKRACEQILDKVKHGLAVPEASLARVRENLKFSLNKLGSG